MAYLSRLSLTSFRNLAHLEMELPTGVVVFFGPNASGKTTLLEAVYILSIARSFRAENEREVVSFETATEGGQSIVGGAIEKQSERLMVYVGYQSVLASDTAKGGEGGGDGPGYSVRKQIRVNRSRRTAAELVGMVNAVLFSAEDIQLVQGTPSRRRRYLDILISQADPLYLRSLQRYQRVVQQRNQLLRMLREGRAETDELAFWDGELVREGAWLTWRRQEVMSQLSPLCAQHHQQLSDPAENLQVEYHPSVPLGSSLPDTEGRFRASLHALGPRERATSSTVMGPHRDDFKLLINGVDMGAFASRGQARTLGLTLRLSEAAFLAAARGEGPIVLLDDVLSELDAFRRRQVLEKVTQYQQVLITTTDLEPVQGFFGPSAAYFQVKGGGVYPLAGAEALRPAE